MRIPISRCQERFRTEFPSGVFFLVLHFSPFGVNVEGFSNCSHPARMAHFLKYSFPYSSLSELRTGKVPSARHIRVPPAQQSIFYSSPLGACARCTGKEPLRKPSCSLHTFLGRGNGWVLYCAHCPSTFPLCADSEHEYPPIPSGLPLTANPSPHSLFPANTG